MTTKRNYIRLSVLAALLPMVLWAASLSPVTSAHGGHKRNHAPANARRLKSPVRATEENIAQGRELYNKHCASCHGEDGQAKTPIAEMMKVKPTNLTDKAMKGITEGEIYWVITNGIKKSGMPALKQKVSDQQRWQVTLYVKHLIGEHPHAEGKH